MQAFSLRAENLNPPDWAASTHKGNCIVYAKSEDPARKYATLEFWIAAPIRPGQKIRTNPWGNLELVTCTAVHSVSEITSDMEGTIMMPDGEERNPAKDL